MDQSSPPSLVIDEGQEGQEGARSQVRGPPPPPAAALRAAGAPIPAALGAPLRSADFGGAQQDGGQGSITGGAQQDGCQGTARTATPYPQLRNALLTNQQVHVPTPAYPLSLPGQQMPLSTLPRPQTPPFSVPVDSGFRQEVASKMLANGGLIGDVGQMMQVLYDGRGDIKFADPITIKSYCTEGGMSSLIVREALQPGPYIAVKERVLDTYMQSVRRINDAQEQVIKKNDKIFHYSTNFYL